jgi:DNA modification methylase
MTATTDYQDFLRDKADFERDYGQPVPATAVNPILKDHQRDIVRWAVEGGRRAIFAAFGMGKTFMQLESLRLTLAHAGGRALLIAPLGVRGDILIDARKLDIEVKFVRRAEDVDGDGIYLTNYETVRDGKLDVNEFTAVSLDEAGVLRSFGSKTYQTFLTLFDNVKYKFVATATPSPNRYKELIHYAGFLGVMDTGQALTRWFQRDSTQANNLTLYPHKREEFFMWLNSWSIFLQKPSDLGYSDEGYDLPPLDIDWVEVPVDHSTAGVDRDGQVRLFRGGAKDLQGVAKEKRDSLPGRIGKLIEMAKAHHAKDDGQIILWCDLNDEQSAIESELKAACITYSSVHGSLDIDEAERRLDMWRNKETYALIGKPMMLGQGLNLQQANVAIFAGITYKFNDTIQACHRIQRFGQKRPCTVHLIHAESEGEVMTALKDKWAQHRELTSTMTDIIKTYGLSRNSITEALTRSMGIERIEASGDGWTLANNDCVDEATNHMDENSVDMVVTSIPFSNHYEYTPSYNDFGHTDDNDHFWAQMDFLTPQLLKVLKPGRIYACHVKDRINFGNVTGAGIPTVSPFHAEALFHGIKHGFDYMGMITVVTDVVRENNQTYRLGYTEMRKDGTKMGVGSPEYILLFHKPQTDRSKGYADDRVTKEKEDYSLARWQVDAHANWRSSGDRHLTPDELAALPVEQRSRLFTEQTLCEVYDYESHIEVGEALQGKGALPATFMSLMPGSWAPDVWHDVNRMLTLNGEQKRRNIQLHVCPLQFDIVDRLIERYTNPGDLVFDPFMGIGTVALRALKLGRKGRGSELNSGYWADSVKYLEAEERKQDLPTLFDLVLLEAS